MPTPLKITLRIVIALVIIAILLFVAHAIIEARVFAMIARSPGMEITIGSRRGNLITGYDLTRVRIRQTRTAGDTPPSVFSTPRLTVHWGLSPFALTEISWDQALLTISPPDKPEEEIDVGGGSLLPDDTGWLVSPDDIAIGPQEWNGSMSLKLRVDVKEVDGKIDIERLPARLIRLMGTVPEDFYLPDRAIVEINLSGSPQNMRATGSVSNPLTRQTFRF